MSREVETGGDGAAATSVGGATARRTESSVTGFGADFSGAGRVRAGLPASRTIGAANEDLDTSVGVLGVVRVVSVTTDGCATVFVCGGETGFGKRDAGGSDASTDDAFGVRTCTRKYVNPAAPSIATTETAINTRSRVDDDVRPRARGTTP